MIQIDPRTTSCECLQSPEVYSGPPNVLFKWRHFGKYSGTYVDKAPKVHLVSGSLVPGQSAIE